MFEEWKSQWADRGEFRIGRLTISPWQWSMNVHKCNEHWGIQFFCFWLKLWRYKIPPKEMFCSWGWSYQREELFSSLHLNWGEYTKIIDMPWSWKWVKTEYKLRTGGFVERPKHDWEIDTEYQYKRHYPYIYTLKSGEVQNRIAKVTVSRWTWRRRWAWFPGLRVRNYIDVTFDQEVGERIGSWKGGTIGCSYDLRINETPYECLKRMERERKFE